MHISLMISSAILNSCLAFGGAHKDDASASRWIEADAVQTFEKVVSGGHNNHNHNNNHNKSESQLISRASMLS